MTNILDELLLGDGPISREQEKMIIQQINDIFAREVDASEGLERDARATFISDLAGHRFNAIIEVARRAQGPAR